MSQTGSKNPLRLPDNGAPGGTPGDVSSNEASGKETPALMIAGGRPRDPSAMARMASLAFRDLSQPRIAYIGTANGDNPGFFRMMASTLIEAGAGEVMFLHLAEDKPDLESVRADLAVADGVFLAGGEVEDGIYWLKKHGLFPFLKDLYFSGKPFIGVSAGVIMMGTCWVRWAILEKDDTASLFDCLGIIPVLFDVHGEDEDWVELKTALKLLGNGARGIGLPGGCAISADSAGTLINLENEYLVFVNEGGLIRIQ